MEREVIRKKVAVVVGTRPEAIKLAPVIGALRQHTDEIETTVISTAQHRQMLDQVFSLFEITPDVDLNAMRHDQGLGDLTARMVSLMDETCHRYPADLVLIQGDTTTVFAASLAAFYNRIPVAHVEAGLRSHDSENPFPEEINRRLTSVLADIHFVPTQLGKENLLRENIDSEKIVVTGNTVVDALHAQLQVPFSFAGTALEQIVNSGRRIILVTSHRRESWGNDLKNICLALKSLTERFKDIAVVYPVHLNPRVRETVMEVLEGEARIHLTGPLDYLTFLNLMKKSYFVLTDSGGVQEECPTLQKPLLVVRKLTERPEAFKAGLSKIIGSNREQIIAEASRLLESSDVYNGMISDVNPYGDGRAAERIVRSLINYFNGQKPYLSVDQQFMAKKHAGCRTIAETA